MFTNWTPNSLNKKKNIITINFGPQHPAAHGVLRMLLQLNNEYIIKTDIHIGLLHRGTEYLIQNKPYMLNVGYFDRLDYVSMLAQEHAYSLAVENSIPLYTTNLSTQLFRVIFDELTRILNHLLAVSCHALDIGSMSPLFWAFEERENIMGFYEKVSGARMHANLYKPGFDLYLNNVVFDIIKFLPNCLKTIQEVSSILINNKIWKNRLVNVGVYGLEAIQQFSLSGVMARSVGLKKDIRIFTPYSFYNKIKFNSFTAFNGDCFDRFTIRVLEMIESIKIINICINIYLSNKVFNFKNNFKKLSMIDLISEFKIWQMGITLTTNQTITNIESPKGEFGVQLFSLDSHNKAVRCKIRSSSFHHLNLLNSLAINHSLADLVTIVGTIDIVFGEIDR
jgi:NADH dehydrogenase (ubiquinone) Fe-S protein 2